MVAEDIFGGLGGAGGGGGGGAAFFRKMGGGFSGGVLPLSSTSTDLATSNRSYVKFEPSSVALTTLPDDDGEDEDGERLRNFKRLLLIRDSMSLGAALDRRSGRLGSVEAIISGRDSKMSPWLAFLALASRTASSLRSSSSSVGLAKGSKNFQVRSSLLQVELAAVSICNDVRKVNFTLFLGLYIKRPLTLEVVMFYFRT